MVNDAQSTLVELERFTVLDCLVTMLSSSKSIRLGCQSCDNAVGRSYLGLCGYVRRRTSDVKRQIVITRIRAITNTTPAKFVKSD